jgi:bifunctional UDP-N-acetylglucosamine pyrophosphorylase/glucosamine-1-phosphate N-acetyltransferase
MEQLEHVTAVVLAAGIGKRMKSTAPKVLHRVLGREMISYVLNSLYGAGIERPIVVVGHEGNQVVEFIGNRCTYAWQKDQLGTGHAVQCALPLLDNFHGDVIVTCGDTPLITADSYRRLIEERRRTSSSAVLSTMVLDDPKSYGRIKRDSSGNVLGIVEFKDASKEERLIREVNTGTYCFEGGALNDAIRKLTNQNAQGEYYLTDTIAHLLSSGRQVRALVHHDPDEFLGINDPADSALAEERLGQRVKKAHLANGVIIEEPLTVRIEPTVQIGARTRIRPGSILEGSTVIGEDCEIGPHVTLRHMRIADGSLIGPYLLSGRGDRQAS